MSAVQVAIRIAEGRDLCGDHRNGGNGLVVGQDRAETGKTGYPMAIPRLTHKFAYMSRHASRAEGRSEPQP